MITNNDLDLIARDVAETLAGHEGPDAAGGEPCPAEPDTGDEAPAG